MVKGYVPQYGDFIWLDFTPQAGHEQQGTRPALVVSKDAFNQKMGFIFVCPVSNTQRQKPFYVVIPTGEVVTGVIMVDQLRSLDYRARKAQLIGQCLDLLLADVLRRSELPSTDASHTV